MLCSAFALIWTLMIREQQSPEGYSSRQMKTCKQAGTLGLAGSQAWQMLAGHYVHDREEQGGAYCHDINWTSSDMLLERHTCHHLRLLKLMPVHPRVV